VSRLAEAIEEHREIITAVKVGDGQQAAEMMHAHIIGFQAQFMAAL
jgi:DNA-binding GntR family transcriptional regulator